MPSSLIRFSGLLLLRSHLINRTRPRRWLMIRSGLHQLHSTEEAVETCAIKPLKIVPEVSRVSNSIWIRASNPSKIQSSWTLTKTHLCYHQTPEGTSRCIAQDRVVPEPFSSGKRAHRLPSLLPSLEQAIREYTWGVPAQTIVRTLCQVGLWKQNKLKEWQNNNWESITTSELEQHLDEVTSHRTLTVLELVSMSGLLKLLKTCAARGHVMIMKGAGIEVKVRLTKDSTPLGLIYRFVDLQFPYSCQIHRDRIWCCSLIVFGAEKWSSLGRWSSLSESSTPIIRHRQQRRKSVVQWLRD